MLEGRDQRHAPIGRKVAPDLFAVLGQPVIGEDLGPVRAGGGQLEGRCVRGHHHQRRHAEMPRDGCDRLAVIARRETGDAARADTLAQRGDNVHRATELERAGALEVFGLQQHPPPRQRIQHGRADQGRAHRQPRDPPARRRDGIGRDRQRRVLQHGFSRRTSTSAWPPRWPQRHRWPESRGSAPSTPGSGSRCVARASGRSCRRS